jgi:hypothetical protein
MNAVNHTCLPRFAVAYRAPLATSRNYRLVQFAATPTASLFGIVYTNPQSKRYTIEEQHRDAKGAWKAWQALVQLQQGASNE